MNILRIFQFGIKKFKLITYFLLKPNLKYRHTFYNRLPAFHYQSPACCNQPSNTTDQLNVRHFSNYFQDTDAICYNEFKQLRKSTSVSVIDVREKDETWRSGIVPGSICVPLKELESALNMSADQFKKIYCANQPKASDTIIFICRKGGRSYRALKQAKKMGFNNCYFYQGGFMAWFEQERKKREKNN